MQFLHVTIQGTLCLNIIVIAESLPIVTTCCSNGSWSSVAVPQSGREVLLLKIWISILYFFWYQHLDYQYAQSCMCQFIMELNIWLKMCFAIQKIKDCIETTQANYKQNCSPSVVLMKFNNWISMKKRELLGGNNKFHVHFSYWQPFFLKEFKH